jgi:hypothetical protein
MSDTRLSTSINALKQKIKDQIPSASAEQLKRISRSARKLGLTQDTEIENLLNTRANTLVAATTDPTEVELIAAAINELDDTINPTVSTAGTLVGGASRIVTDDSAPGNPEDGDLWFKTDDLDLYVYYDDGTSSQWVQTNAASITGTDISDLTDNNELLGSGSSTIPFTKFYLSASQPGSTVSSSSYLGQNVGTWYEVPFANAANTAGLSPDSSDRDPTLTGITFSGDKFSGFVQNGTYEISVQPEVYERNTTAGQRYHGWEASTGAFSSAGWLSPGTGSFDINGVTVPDSIIVTFEDATPSNNWVRYILETDQSGDYWIGQAVVTIKKIG